MADAVYEPIGLGYACETKYQLARVLSARMTPGRSNMAFRLTITQEDHGEKLFLWRLFDWQSTPFQTVCLYLERDFQGFFEREDLAITIDGVVNTRFGTRHLHEFPPMRGRTQLVDADIDRSYATARQRFERMCEDFKRLLTLPGPYLYVFADKLFPEKAAVERLIGLLSARSPDHRFHLLLIADEGAQEDLSGLGGQVTQTWRPRDSQKPSVIEWEGHDAAWDACLAPFALTMHEPPAAMVRKHAAAQPDKGPPEPGRKRGFLGGLLGR